METLENIVLLLHITSAVFMAWPLYGLITVNERPKVGVALGDKVDDFMEGIIKKNSIRCYVFQTTALLTGLYLVWSHEGNLTPLIDNWRLMGKTTGLFVLMGILSYVVFSLQPRIDSSFAQLREVKRKEKVAKEIGALRLRRKALATVCLFVVLTVILLAVQIRQPIPIIVNLILIILIALFTNRVYRKNIPYGWA